MIVDSNIIHSIEGAGLAMQNGTSHSTITNNTVFQVQTQALQFNDYWNTGCPSGPICPYDQNYNTIENNTLFVGTTDWEGASATGQMSIGIFHADSSGGVAFPSITGDLGHNIYRNNILSGTTNDVNYPAVAYEFASSSSGTNYYQSSAAAEMTSDTWTNNLIYTGVAAVVSDGYKPGSGSYGYRSYTCTQFAGLSTVSGCINSNPNVAALGAWNTPWLFNFALQSGSPAIGAGTATGQPTYDIRGIVRTVPPDLGAYQFNVGGLPIGVSINGIPNQLINIGSPSAGHTSCWNGVTISYCTTVVASNGTCTCH